MVLTNKRYIDKNFLGGELTIEVDTTRQTTVGTVVVDLDGVKRQFYAKTKCRKQDTFNEAVGIDIVKMKIVKSFYAYKRETLRNKINLFNKVLRKMNDEYNHATKKYNNTKIALAAYGQDNTPPIVEEPPVEVPAPRRGRRKKE